MYYHDQGVVNVSKNSIVEIHFIGLVSPIQTTLKINNQQITPSIKHVIKIEEETIIKWIVMPFREGKWEYQVIIKSNGQVVWGKEFNIGLNLYSCESITFSVIEEITSVTSI